MYRESDCFPLDCENECESLCQAILASDVERVIVARDNESESLSEAI